jgi:hypothetical protein
VDCPTARVGRTQPLHVQLQRRSTIYSGLRVPWPGRGACAASDRHRCPPPKKKTHPQALSSGNWEDVEVRLARSAGAHPARWC